MTSASSFCKLLWENIKRRAWAAALLMMVFLSALPVNRSLVLENADIYLVSDLEDGVVKKLFLQPYHTVQEAYDAAVRKHGHHATVLAMPYGGSTLPRAL